MNIAVKCHAQLFFEMHIKFHHGFLFCGLISEWNWHQRLHHQELVRYNSLLRSRGTARAMGTIQ